MDPSEVCAAPALLHPPWCKAACEFYDRFTTAERMNDMKLKPTNTPHKLGANQKEAAVKAVKHDANFKQSRDIREDRGTRQMKTTKPGGAQHGK